MAIEVHEVDYARPEHRAGILDLLDSYAADRFGGGKSLAQDVRERLVPALRDHPTALVLLAFDRQRPVGIAVCFFGFSTFRASPLLNVHDLAVLPECRGRGIGRTLLEAAEAHADARGCCKLTLEVQDGNTRARALYQRFGFGDFVLGDTGATRFLSKELSPRG